jgi:hypothetical protein
MSVPSLLAFSALAATAAAMVLPGLSDLILISLPSLVAALWLWFRAPRRHRPARTPQQPASPAVARGVFTGSRSSPQSSDRPTAPIAKASLQRPIVIDGSNVLYWKDNSPQITTLQMVVNRLKEQGFAPGVVFDANAGYLLTGRYQHDGGLARMLNLPEDQVLVVAKGTPADPTILHIARSLRAPVLSNDRYRDWLETYPEARDPGRLIRGRIDETGLWLDMAGQSLPHHHPA